MEKSHSYRGLKAGFLALAVMIANVSGMGNLYADKTAAPAEAAAKVVNINQAGAEELQEIRGVGPAIAERILQYRQEHGRFEKPEDLVNVRGIGPAKFEKIKAQISIS